MMAKPHKKHSTFLGSVAARDFSRLGFAVLVALALVEFVVPHHGYFGLDGTLGFALWYGALACFTLILIALAVGSLLRSPEATYDD